MANIWHTSVFEATRIAQEAMRALVPIVEKAQMPWREPNNYDDWDLIAASIYKAIVIMSVENSFEFVQASAIVDYDMRYDDYSQFSFVTDLASTNPSAFVRLETDRQPFDTGLFAELDENERVKNTVRRPFDQVDWAVAARRGKLLDKFRSLSCLL